jgi:hypothetical protein
MSHGESPSHCGHSSSQALSSNTGSLESDLFGHDPKDTADRSSQNGSYNKSPHPNRVQRAKRPASAARPPLTNGRRIIRKPPSRQGDR